MSDLYGQDAQGQPVHNVACTAQNNATQNSQFATENSRIFCNAIYFYF